MKGTTRTVTAMSCGLVAIAAIGATSTFGASATTGTTTAAAQVRAHADHHSHDSHDSEHASGGDSANERAKLRRDLAKVRRVTARFHDLDKAIAAGYELGWVNGSGTKMIAGCVAHPTDGAMGYHYFNKDLMATDEVNLLEPEVLVYETGDDGELDLVAVEWAARGPNSNPRGPAEPPTVLGKEMHILVPAVGFYIMHAWIWKANPSGVLADWNPRVTCP